MKTLILGLLFLFVQPDLTVQSGSCTIWDDPDYGRTVQFDLEVVSLGTDPGEYILETSILHDEGRLIVSRDNILGAPLYASPSALWPESLEWGRDYEAVATVDPDNWFNESNEDNNSVVLSCQYVEGL